MKDIADDPDTAGQRLLDETRTGGLRKRMRSHLDAHESPEDLKSFRQAVTVGNLLSEAVDVSREERT